MSLILHYHPLSSYCWKVLIALDEKGVKFEARMVDFGDAAAQSAFIALWPTGKIPLLEDDGRPVPETSIMIEYVDRRWPGDIQLVPDDPAQQLEVRLWDRLFDLYVMTPMQNYIAQLLRPEDKRDPQTSADALAALDRAYDMIEARLAGRRWAAGDRFSMADCAAAPALFYADIVQPFGPKRPVLQHYFEALMARPSVQRAIVQAQPFFQYFPLNEKIPARFLPENAG